MNYDDLKNEIKTIANIANEVPESFRNKCFELLLQHLLEASETHIRGIESKLVDKKLDNDEQDEGLAKAKPSDTMPTPSQVKVFLQKTGVTAAEVHKILIYEDNEVHFVREPTTHIIARGQIEWALLLALRNCIIANNFSVDPESVRSICQEKGFYDQRNFSYNFKKAKNAALFQGPMEPQGQAQKLTSEGQKELGKLVKELGASDS